MSFEQTPSLETEKYSSKIELKFFRHDEKGKAGEGETDNEVLLTPAGRQHAKSQAELYDISQAVAFGSPRLRAQETAGFTMAGNLENVTGEETLEELKEKIDKGLGYGTKLATDKRLDFNSNFATPYGQKALGAFKSGRYLKFLVEESDRVAEETNDEESSTYNRQAGAIASILKKYLSISPRFDKLVKDEAKDYEKEMYRFFGTHQGVAESFLIKVVEKMKGVGERNKLVSLLNQGFDYFEGFTVEVLTNNEQAEPVIKINYSKKGAKSEDDFIFNEIIPKEIVDEIVIGDISANM
ncbi:MAG: hypothetical protein AAB453_00295 [Patescibacteria group bacterium]